MPPDQTSPVTPAQASAAPFEQAGPGIVLMILAVAVFATMNGVIKWVSLAGIPVLEIIFFRSFFALIPTALHIARNGGFGTLATKRPGGHLLRSGIGVAAMVCSFSALSMLPLAEATAISFSAPLFMTALSVPFLGEKVRIRRWSAIAVGFAGVLIMVRPDPAHLAEAGALVALAAAVLYAGAMITIRHIGTTEAGPTIVFYFTLTATILSALVLPFVWVTPDPATLALLVLIGLLGGIGQLLLTQAFRTAPVAVVAPFDYTALLWATLIGYAVWSEVPSATTLIGGLIVVGSGLYILHRETKLGLRRAIVARLWRR